MEPRSTTTYPGKVAAALALAAIAAVLWLFRGVLLLAFGGILFAVALSALAQLLARRGGIGWRAAVIASVLLVLAALAGLGYWLGSELAAQAAQLGEQLPQALAALRDWLASKPLGPQLLEQVRQMRSDGVPIGRMASFAAVTAGAIGNLVLMLLIAVFLSAEPPLYRQGAVRLLPVRHRERVESALLACGDALRGWLKGQGLSMLFVGTATAVGLWLLDVPLALLLGVLAAVLNFVPFFGPIASGLLAVLLAFVQGPQTALYVALLGLAIQQVEGNLVMPLVQRWAVQLPPALGVVAVVLAATLFGLPGILLATPLMVVVMVLVQKLYVEGALEGSAAAPRRPAAG